MSNSNGENRFDPKQDRKENPTGWMYIARYETVRLLIDALLEAPPNYEFNKTELARRAGVSRESVRKHIDSLVNLGIIDELDTEGWTEYRRNDDSRITKELLDLNNAVNAVRSGQTSDTDQIVLRLKKSPSRFKRPRNMDGFAEDYVQSDKPRMEKISSQNIQAFPQIKVES